MTKKRGEKYYLILDAAVKVFAQKGFANSRVNDVAKGAGVAEGTIYLYFSRKEDILISLVEEKMAYFTLNLEKKLTLEGTPFDKLKQIISWHLSFLGNNKDIAMVTQIEMRQSDPNIRIAFDEPLRQYFLIIEEVIRNGQEEGSFDRDNNVTHLRKIIFGALDEIVTRWVLAKKEYNLEEMIEPIFMILKKTLQA